MSCPHYCCCPCLTSSKKKSRYAYVRYAPSSSSSEPKKEEKFVSSLSDPIDKRPEKLFTFAQEPNKVVAHPEISAIIDQPKSNFETTNRLKFNDANAPQRNKLPKLSLTDVDSDESCPFIQFSLNYDVQKHELHVHLHSASNLPAKDRRGTSDPFVVLYLVPNKEEIFESKIVYKSLNPVFDQSFEFKSLMPDDIQQQTLVLRVYDYDKYSKNDTIGGVVLPLKDVDLFGVEMKMKVEEKPNIFNDVS